MLTNLFISDICALEGAIGSGDSFFNIFFALLNNPDTKSFILNIRFSTSAITAGAAEIFAYGSAVVVEPLS